MKEKKTNQKSLIYLESMGVKLGVPASDGKVHPKDLEYPVQIIFKNDTSEPLEVLYSGYMDPEMNVEIFHLLHKSNPSFFIPPVLNSFCSSLKQGVLAIKFNRFFHKKMSDGMRILIPFRVLKCEEKFVAELTWTDGAITGVLKNHEGCDKEYNPDKWIIVLPE